MTRPVVTHDPDGIAECYSDHAHDIGTVGSCMFCDSTDPDVIGHILPQVGRLKGIDPVQAAAVVMHAGSAKMIDGVLLDVYTASAIQQVHNALGPANQASLRATSLERAAALCFGVLERARKKGTQ